jgi:hypothetical protein
MGKSTYMLFVASASVSLFWISGCTSTKIGSEPYHFSSESDQNAIQLASAEFDASNSPTLSEPTNHPLLTTPFSLDDQNSVEYWNVTLDETIQMALANSAVLRDLGARIIQSPELVDTIYQPAIRKTDPQFGVEAALSEFDAQLAAGLFYERNDRALNNSFLGGGTNFFFQDLWRMRSELRKRAATGTQFSLRHNVEDNLNNAPANIFGTAGLINAHAWDWNLEAEVRHPLLQGGGVAFNRIAGPSKTPGVINGVLIARVNADISAVDFQLALRDYLSNVENAYWDLVFAYRDLEVKKTARDDSLATWQELKKRNELDVAGANADKVAQAAEQYYRFQQEVEDALSGRLIERTRDFNGSTGGTFLGAGGIYVSERRLRNIVGLPISDGRLIRPITEPTKAKIVFDWEAMSAKSLDSRSEIIRQRMRIKRSNMQLIASRNFLYPTLDAVGRYRFRGLGNSLYGKRVPGPSGALVDSDKSEWQVGMEMSLPIGFRRAHSGVRNAQLDIARERALLENLERQIIHDVSNAITETSRSYRSIETTWNRLTAAKRQFDLLKSYVVQEVKGIDFNLVLDAERRLAEARVAYNRALISYTVALKNVHLETGSIMEHSNIQLTESIASN